MKTIHRVAASLFLSATLGISGAIATESPKTTKPAPSVASEEKAAVATLLSHAKDWGICTDSLDLEAARRVSQAYKLDNRRYLVMVNCFLAAYQGNYEFWLYTQSKDDQPVDEPIKQLTLTEYTQNAAGKVVKIQSKSIGALPKYEPKSRMLRVMSKYRGLGDCGAIAKYHLENSGFKLLEFRAKFECDGKLEPLRKLYP